MTEEELFGEAVMWKDKYRIKWCEMCETYMISCLEPECHGSSCNGGGCEKCHDAVSDFLKTKHHPYSYLNGEEKIIYKKISFLKKYIKESLRMGDYEINWQKLETAGKLCGAAYKLFPEETKNLIPYNND